MTSDMTEAEMMSRPGPPQKAEVKILVVPREFEKKTDVQFVWRLTKKVKQNSIAKIGQILGILAHRN